jgi:AgrD protein
MLKNVSEKVLKTVAKSAYSNAEKTANSACIWFAYQPKLPKAMKDLRKF